VFLVDFLLNMKLTLICHLSYSFSFYTFLVGLFWIVKATLDEYGILFDRAVTLEQQLNHLKSLHMLVVWKPFRGIQLQHLASLGELIVLLFLSHNVPLKIKD